MALSLTYFGHFSCPNFFSHLILTGKFRVIESRIVRFDEGEILETKATVQTGLESHGGLHTVILYGKTTRIANAFVKVNGSDGMLVTISGTLFSGKEDSRVYVKWIRFHVPPDVESAAIELYSGEQSRGRRGTGMVA
jgi:hypothetical protein